MSQISLSEFADKLNDMMPVIMKEFARRQTNELYKGKITLPQFLVLEFLETDGEVKMKDIAQFMHVSTAAMTGIVDRLVREGYVVRAFDAVDRRIIKAQLTVRGSSIVKKINGQRRDITIRIFEKISETDRNEYLKILRQIRDILVKEGPGLK